MDNRHDLLINELASACGIIHEYWDIFGNRHTASLESKKRVLQAMGLDCSSEDSMGRQIEELKVLRWSRLLQPVYVATVNELPLKIPVSIQIDGEGQGAINLCWSICPKGNNKEPYREEINNPSIVEENSISGKRYIKTLFTLSNTPEGHPLSFGYYDLKVTVTIGKKRQGATSRVIITPTQCYIDPTHWGGKDLWGLSINLYSLRSANNWGVGDLTDLARCVKEIYKLGGAFVGINPLHAITNQPPYGISPYSPISRLFMNFIYLDLNKVEGFHRLPMSEDMQQKIELLRGRKLIDYKAVAELKIEVLERLFEDFYKNHIKKESKEAAIFRDYIEEQGEKLQLFALYCALAEDQGKKASKDPLYSWRNWDKSYHRIDSKETITFKERHKERVLFYCYVQWQIERQLVDVYEESKPMGIGIYNDLAVGSIRDGFDEWLYQGLFASKANAGAPPDDFNPAGQDWGFPPFNPLALRENAYEPFIECLRSNMRYAGALRIDHALGLFRMFWIPSGSKPSEGVYVQYPWEDMLKIIALESHLNRTVVIAEDLGTITDQARDALRRFQMLSYKLLYFQRNYPDPSFTMPEHYPDHALCTVTTHDLPTLSGFWAGRDIELRNQLSLFSSRENYIATLKDRERDRHLLIDALIAKGILPKGHPVPQDMNTELMTAIYEFLALSRSKLLALSLDDLMGTMDQQNMPGTVEEYPCWIQKTPLLIEDFLRSEVMLRMSLMLKRYR